ncbi:MAG: hypothetical protein KCHDKBKB_01417 [Elusimicrobia bacterium]|nr:hypothetical protein [Elusimicrobiota bacterium]
MKKLPWFTFVFCLVPFPALALNTEAFAVHLRKTLGLDTRTEIKISSTVTPAGFGNLNVVTANLGGAPYPIYITQDETKYFWGYAVDATIDPDKSRQMQINLKGTHSKGSEKAPVTIVEYSDMQCGYCKVAHNLIKTNLEKNYSKDQVRLVFKHFPLNGHEWSEPAAIASECAAQQKEPLFWDMLDYFFTNQEKITKDNYKEKIAEGSKQLNLDQKKFNACLESPVVLGKIRADKKEGTSVGVTSTPALFINGRQRRGLKDFDDIKVVIEEKLQEVQQ